MIPETVTSVDWQAVAQLAMQQRDQATVQLTQRVYALEIELAIERKRIAEFERALQSVGG